MVNLTKLEGGWQDSKEVMMKPLLQIDHLVIEEMYVRIRDEDRGLRRISKLQIEEEILKNNLQAQ